MTSYTFTMDVTVHDEQAVWRKAYATYEEQKGTADQGDLELMIGTLEEPDVAGCLQMIFDPGVSPDGCSIQGSECE